MSGGKHVQSVDLVVEGNLTFDRQGFDEVANGFGSVRCAIVDRLHLPKGRSRTGQLQKLLERNPIA